MCRLSSLILVSSVTPFVTGDNDTIIPEELKHTERNGTTVIINSTKKGRIVGGTVASRDEHPWIVSLHQAPEDRSYSWLSCGGALIAPAVVLTAAHCQNKVKFAEIGRYNQFDNTGVSVYPVYADQNFFPHPEYDDRGLNNDFALIQLPERHPDVSMAILNDDPKFPAKEGDAVVVAGWGRVEEDGYGSDVLLETTMDYVPPEQCFERFNQRYITENMLCAYREGFDACQGVFLCCFSVFKQQ